jgi:hypothetical protein
VFGTPKELATQGGSAAGEDLFQNLARPWGHGGAEPRQLIAGPARVPACGPPR